MLTNSGYRFPKCKAGKIRTKVFCSVFFIFSYYFHSRKVLFVINPYIRKMLVILQKYVVIRFILLDEIAFEIECLGLIPNDNKIKIINICNH